MFKPMKTSNFIDLLIAMYSFDDFMEIYAIISMKKKNTEINSNVLIIVDSWLWMIFADVIQLRCVESWNWKKNSTNNSEKWLIFDFFVKNWYFIRHF